VEFGRRGQDKHERLLTFSGRLRKQWLLERPRPKLYSVERSSRSEEGGKGDILVLRRKEGRGLRGREGGWRVLKRGLRVRGARGRKEKGASVLSLGDGKGGKKGRD